MVPCERGSAAPRCAVIGDLSGIEEKIDRKQASATQERVRAAGGGLTVGPLALSTVLPPGAIGRGGAKWLVGDKYIVRVTDEQAGHLFSISHRSDSWPAATIGPWEDPQRLMNLAHLLKSSHVRVSHYDHDKTRHYRLVF